MKDELTRLHVILDALLKFDYHQTQAAFDWDDEIEDYAFEHDEKAEEALEQAIQLARKERS